MKVHFISIGGSVMHQLAIALLKKGYEVTGSDDEIFEPALTALTLNNLLPKQTGWFPENIHPGLDAVILGMHAKDDNPELQQARALNLKIYSFPEYVFEEAKDAKRIVVGGSHGKTSTTAMIMHALQYAQKTFDFLVGAKLKGFDAGVKISGAPLIVCEGDEYPASALEKRPKFHFLFPHVAILTGIAWDHINVFPTFDFYVEQFKIFIDKIEPGGLLIYNATDAVLTQLVEENKRSDIQYQPYAVPQHEIVDGKTFVWLDGVKAPLKVFGNHNLLNLHAAYLACKTEQIFAEAFLEAMENFTGAAKRLELIASGNGVNVYRDFAHAPSKLAATIAAVREQYPNSKLIAVFELHTFSSLSSSFLSQYRNSLNSADEAAVFYSEHALQLKRLPPLDPNTVKAEFNNEQLSVLTSNTALIEWLSARDYANANILLMSSGNYEGANIETFANAITQQSHGT